MNDTQKQLRIKLLDFSFRKKLEHIPSALSEIDFIYCLFNNLKNNLNDYEFVIGKVWGAQGIYIPLSELGLLKNIDDLDYILNGEQTFLKHKIENFGNSTGFSAGVALGTNKQVINIISDGEMQSGYFYEACNFIAQHNLPITIIVDCNNAQVCDCMENILSLSRIKKSISQLIPSFECNGHDFDEISKINFNGHKIIFMNTIKGYGVKSMMDFSKHYAQIANEFELEQLKNEVLYD